MENLIIKHKVHTVLRKILGVLFIISGIAWLIIHIGQMNWFHWIYTIFYTGIGIAYTTTAFGSDISEAVPGDNFIKIRWMNWLRPRIVSFSEIEKLTFTMFDIEISRKAKKPIKLRLDFMEKPQMKEVRQYFLQMAGENGIKVENRYHG